MSTNEAYVSEWDAVGRYLDVLLPYEAIRAFVPKEMARLESRLQDEFGLTMTQLCDCHQADVYPDGFDEDKVDAIIDEFYMAFGRKYCGNSANGETKLTYTWKVDRSHLGVDWCTPYWKLQAVALIEHAFTGMVSPSVEMQFVTADA